MIRSFFFTRYSGCLSRSGDILNSLCWLFSLIYSSKVRTISFCLKLRVRLTGSSFKITGGIESFGPPVGVCMLAHRIKLSDISKANTNKKLFCKLNLLFKFAKLFIIFLSIKLYSLITLIYSLVHMYHQDTNIRGRYTGYSRCLT